MPKESLRNRVASKLAEANRTGVAPVIARREQRLVPALVRSPRAGFTPELLQAQKQKLKRVEEVRVHGGLDNVHVKRAAGQDAGAFANMIPLVNVSLPRRLTRMRQCIAGSRSGPCFH